MTPYEEKDSLERCLALLNEARRTVSVAGVELIGVQKVIDLRCRCAEINLTIAKLYADVHAALDERIAQGGQP